MIQPKVSSMVIRATQKPLQLRLVGAVSAGFPLPGEDYASDNVDLRTLLVANPASTFFMRVSGTSMKNSGILDGDIIVVDRSIKPRRYDIVVASLESGFTLKRLSQISKDQIKLSPDNPEFSSLYLGPENELTLWGVVTFVIHQTR